MSCSSAHSTSFKPTTVLVSPQLAYYFLLGLVPAIVFLLGITSFFPSDAILGVLMGASAFMAAEAIDLVCTQLQSIANGQHGGVASFGFVMALWSSAPRSRTDRCSESFVRHRGRPTLVEGAPHCDPADTGSRRVRHRSVRARPAWTDRRRMDGLEGRFRPGIRVGLQDRPARGPNSMRPEASPQFCLRPVRARSRPSAPSGETRGLQATRAGCIPPGTGSIAIRDAIERNTRRTTREHRSVPARSGRGASLRIPVAVA